MIQFQRTDNGDGAAELLTICVLVGGATRAVECLTGEGTVETPYVVQIEAGDAESGPGDFVGLYDLDGDRIESGRLSWEVASDVPEDVIAAVIKGWGETGTSTLRRLPAQDTSETHDPAGESRGRS